jgi:hypothetical protein
MTARHIVRKETVYLYDPSLGPCDRHLDGVPYNFTLQVSIWWLTTVGYGWTTHRGNQPKAMRGPFPTPDSAAEDAHCTLGDIRIAPRPVST